MMNYFYIARHGEAENNRARNSDAVVLIVAHSGVIAAVDAACKGVALGGHHISEAYAHDFVGRFTFQSGKVATFETVGR